MIAAMSSEAAPPQLTYDETFTPYGLGLRILSVRGTSVVHVAYSSDKTVHVFHVRQTDGQNTVQLVDAASGQQYTAELPFWSPAWLAPQAPPTPADQTTVISATREKMLADLISANGSPYAPVFAGVENLNGFLVYHLRLSSQDAGVHPLSDVYLDERSYLVRRAIGDFRDTSVTTVTGDVVLDFGNVGRFWLVTAGRIDATVHAYFLTRSGSATFAASRIVAGR